MARPAYSIGNPNRPQSVILTLVGGVALTAWGAHTAKFRMPQTAQIIGITANVGAKGGTHSVSTIDVKVGATSVLASLLDVAAATAGTPFDKEGAALAAGAASVAKDSVISVVTAESGGTSPTVQDVTVQIDYIPLGD